MRQWLVDAFANGPFTGNPACVVEPFDAWPSTDWMQALSGENNQAETAFLRTTNDPARFDLRWMTPTLEVPLCGHATLAASHVLLNELQLDAASLTFDTASGPLTVTRKDRASYEMDFPALPASLIATPSGLSEAIDAPILEVWQSTYLVALVDDEKHVKALKPDIAAIDAIVAQAIGGRGNLVVAAINPAGSKYDVVSRFFAPGSGVDEDPATGSAHCILAPLLATKTGRTQGRYFQAYPGRGGEITCALEGNRVLLGGQGVTILEGVLRVRPDMGVV